MDPFSSGKNRNGGRNAPVYEKTVSRFQGYGYKKYHAAV
jgi:hypothetical protein